MNRLSCAVLSVPHRGFLILGGILFPVDALPQEDKKCIENWIKKYTDIDEVDVDAALSAWSKNKKKLFKAFGRNLRVSYPVKTKMSKKDFVDKLREFYPRQLSIQIRDVYNYPNHGTLAYALGKYIIEKCDLDWQTKRNIEKLFSYDNIHSGVVPFDLYFEFSGKPLKLQKNMKIMKAILKITKALNFPYPFLYEQFRDNVSNITTQQYIDANLVFSIHPIDFMTMSDNESNWSSCMSWEHGSYSAGTIEMLNSNVAVVAYLENKKQPTFQEWKEIPNKSWRCLYYVHKDILLSGKPYPYYNKNLVRLGLDKLAELVYANMKWQYSFKNQRYKDCIHIRNSSYVRAYRPDKKYLPKNKANIMVYTYGMYNDIVADTEQEYWCYRNKPKKPLYLSLSGRATCMMCGKPFDMNYNELDKEPYYNKWYDSDEYRAFGSYKCCEKCVEEYQCHNCGKTYKHDHIKVKMAHIYPNDYYSHRSHRRITIRFNTTNLCSDCLLLKNEYLYSKKAECVVKQFTYDEYRNLDPSGEYEKYLGKVVPVDRSIVEHLNSLQIEQ